MKCHAPGCDRDARTGGLCSAHYQQQRRTGALRPLRSEPQGAQFALRLSQELLDAVAYCAEGAGVDRAAWIRGALVRETQRAMADEADAWARARSREERDDAEDVDRDDGGFP